MSLFDQLVSLALKNQSEFSVLRPVVEKELLHHDILREMSSAGLLRELTFIGGTCLRACYGSNRLSEDLDFTGGSNFKRESLASLASVLREKLFVKYSLKVEVSEPVKDTGNVDTWKIKIQTRPQRRNLPLQRINIDICSIPSYDKKPMILRNHYGLDMGTQGLIIQAQSREEILADKLVAFALRSNRLKNRDLWDIGWLKQQNVNLPIELIEKKVADHKSPIDNFLKLLENRQHQLTHDPNVHQAFVNEIRRFLPQKIVKDTVTNDNFWIYLVDIINTESIQIINSLSGVQDQSDFKM